MKRGKILAQLWYSDASLRVTEWTAETEKVLTELEEQEENLFATLTREQKDALNTYKTDLLNLCTLYEKDAFTKGVQFATAYMIEALGQTDNG